MSDKKCRIFRFYGESAFDSLFCFRPPILSFFLSISLFLLLTLSIPACQDQPGNTASNLSITVSGPQSGLSDTPFSTLSELDALTNLESGKEYVYWRMARVNAMLEMESFRARCNWFGAKLSERPIIIYDEFSRPRYYEYRVYREGEDIGTITAFAQKRDGNAVAYILPYALDYRILKTKGPGYKVIANGYPRTALGIINKTGESVSATVDGNGSNITLQPLELDYITNHLENYTNSNITIDMITNYATYVASNNKVETEMDEKAMQEYIAVSTNDAIMAAVFEEIRSRTKTGDFDGGKAVTPFDGMANSPFAWWDNGWNIRQLQWNTTPYLTNGDGRCGMVAMGIFLTFYNETAKIRNTATYDGYYHLGQAAQIDWPSGSIGETYSGQTTPFSGYKLGIGWATENRIQLDEYMPQDWTYGDGSWYAATFHMTTFDRIKTGVDNNNIFLFSRPGHQTVAIGYKSEDIYKLITSYENYIMGYRTVYFLWWSWLEEIIGRRTVTRNVYDRTEKYILFTDNGYQQSQDSGGYVNVLKNKSTDFSRQLFWENIRNSAAVPFNHLMWKK